MYIWSCAIPHDSSLPIPAESKPLLGLSAQSQSDSCSLAFNSIFILIYSCLISPATTKKNFAFFSSSNMSSRSALTQRHHAIADIPPTEPPSQRDLVQEMDRRTRSQLKTNGSIFGHATSAEVPMATIALPE